MTVVSTDSSSVRALTRGLPTDLRQFSFHLIGIGGSGMSGLAALLLRHGARVSGSDCNASLAIVRLLEQGARITTRQAAEALPVDTQYVVGSAAIPEQHVELREATRRGLPIFKYAELLGALMRRRHGIAISGTHGKSSTSAWLTYVLKRAGLDPSFVIGAECDQLAGGSGVGDGPHFVAEACEYDRSFLHLRPRSAAILNIEEDHLDYYSGLDDIVRAFERFASGVLDDGLIALNADDARCRKIADTLHAPHAPVETFAIDADATWRASGLAIEDGTYGFDVSREGRPLGRVRCGVAGRHNVSNALAVIALANHAGVAWERIRAGLAEFRGVKRRLELRGEVAGVRVVDDYGHHPTEIRATLQAARDRFAPQRLWCVFQPHQHSRTRFLLEDFARSFTLADRVIVPDIYFVRDTQRDREAVSAEDLVERIRQQGGDAVYIPCLDAIAEPLSRELKAGDLVLTMGAGTIWKVADALIHRLGAELPH